MGRDFDRQEQRQELARRLSQAGKDDPLWLWALAREPKIGARNKKMMRLLFFRHISMEELQIKFGLSYQRIMAMRATFLDVLLDQGPPAPSRGSTIDRATARWRTDGCLHCGGAQYREEGEWICLQCGRRVPL